MTEPTSSNYPTSYDDTTSLLGQLEERRVGIVKTSIDVAALQITFDRELTGLTGPLNILFEGGEIWWVEADGITIAGGETIISLDVVEQRGYHNSIVQPHNAGEMAYFTINETRVNQMKRAIEALQSNGFRLGDSTARAAYESSAVAGEGWLETDTQKIYYCFSAGTFVWVNISSHSDLTGLADDDHDTGANAYHTDGRADTWHGLLTGTHIVGGDDHDHYSASEGSAVVRVDGGLDASKGTPSFIGHLYFATDTELLYISADGSTWEKISGAPSGGITFFDTACPSGWTRYTNLDGKYVYIDNTTPGSSGGANTHSHTYSVIREHYHGMDAPTTSSQTDPGNHSHQVKAHSGSGGDSRPARTSTTTSSITSSSGGGHSHTSTLVATTTTQTGVASPETTTENGEAPYKELVPCQKD